jgi:hypothetical protein
MSIELGPLATETWIKIFSYLEEPDLANCCRVSSEWNQLASDNLIWKDIAKKTFNGEVPETANFKDFLRSHQLHQLDSNEKIIQKIESFLNEISLGEMEYEIERLMQAKLVEFHNFTHQRNVKIYATIAKVTAISLSAFLIYYLNKL